MVELKKYTIFWSYYSLISIGHKSFKVYKFLKTGFYGKCILISSIGKFSQTSLSKIDIDIINQELLFWLCHVKLSIRHNSFIRKCKCAFIWCSYILKHHFVLFFIILSQKEKFYIKKKNNTQTSYANSFFIFYVRWTHILRGSLFIKVVSQLI